MHTRWIYSIQNLATHSPGDSVSKMSVPLRQTLMNQKVIVANCDDFETAGEDEQRSKPINEMASLISLSMLNDVDLDLLIVTKHLS